MDITNQKKELAEVLEEMNNRTSRTCRFLDVEIKFCFSMPPYSDAELRSLAEAVVTLQQRYQDTWTSVAIVSPLVPAVLRPRIKDILSTGVMQNLWFV